VTKIGDQKRSQSEGQRSEVGVTDSDKSAIGDQRIGGSEVGVEAKMDPPIFIEVGV